jgi:hypothetical protein
MKVNMKWRNFEMMQANVSVLEELRSLKQELQDSL